VAVGGSAACERQERTHPPLFTTTPYDLAVPFRCRGKPGVEFSQFFSPPSRLPLRSAPVRRRPGLSRPKYPPGVIDFTPFISFTADVVFDTWLTRFRKRRIDPRPIVPVRYYLSAVSRRLSGPRIARVCIVSDLRT